MRTTAVIMVAMLVGVAQAEASEIPRYDVAKHCSKVASFGGAMSEALRESCFDMEQQAYNVLKASWDNLSPNMKSHCNGVATFGGTGSYSLLESCIQMEQSAQQKNKARQFKY